MLSMQLDFVQSPISRKVKVKSYLVNEIPAGKNHHPNQQHKH